MSVSLSVRLVGALLLMASSTPARKLRLLCLHGFRTSGKIMRQQMEKAKWIEAIGDLVEFVFVDAVWFATGPSNVEKIFEPPYFEWYQANKVSFIDAAYIIDILMLI